MIEGRLLSRSGDEFSRDQIVRLRAVDGRPFELLDVSSEAVPRFLSGGGHAFYPTPRSDPGSSAYPPHSHVFEFNEVPEGRYELSVVAQDGYSWTPAVQIVSPPAGDVVFERVDDRPSSIYRFRVLVGETGEPVDAYRVQVQIGSTWNPGSRLMAAPRTDLELPAGEPFRWTLHAPGFRPAAGDQDDFASHGGAYEATVRLEPGWGARLHVRDLGHGFQPDDRGGLLAAAERPGIPGARVFADGEWVGTTDAAGFVALALPAEPERLTVEAAGYRTAGSAAFRDGRIAGEVREVVVWMVPE